MTSPGRGARRRSVRVLAWGLAAALLLLAAAAGLRLLGRDGSPGQAMAIPGAADGAPGPWPAARPRAEPTGPPFLTSVSADRRYFLDQYGQPYLLRGDAPWSLMTDLSPDQAELWFSTRARQGFNAAIVSLLGSPDNGGPSEDGATFDGLEPFADGDVLRWNEPYWDRVTAYLRMAADHGITVLLYPVDGWTIGRAFAPDSIDQCRRYGARLAERFADLPNLVWLTGGDYTPATADPARGSDVDRCWDAVMRGIRERGDGRPFSIQLNAQKSISSDNPFWAPRLDWNFVYTYYPTYRAVLEAYERTPPLPAVLGEANYEGENNQPETPPTTDETLRRQVLWSLTSGAAGEIRGSSDWKFDEGWEERLDTPAVAQLGRLRDLFTGLPWWQFVPDTTDGLVTAGRGTRRTDDTPADVLDDDWATVARTPDGSRAVVYVPTERTLTLDTAALPAGTRATWVDPTSGRRTAVPLERSLRTPGTNDQGDGDWLLLLTP